MIKITGKKKLRLLTVMAKPYDSKERKLLGAYRPHLKEVSVYIQEILRRAGSSNMAARDFVLLTVLHEISHAWGRRDTEAECDRFAVKAFRLLRGRVPHKTAMQAFERKDRRK